jgi:hypothetical protein
LRAPTALLLILADKDSFFPLESVKALYEGARETKALSVLPRINHF